MPNRYTPLNRYTSPSISWRSGKKLADPTKDMSVKSLFKNPEISSGDPENPGIFRKIKNQKLTGNRGNSRKGQKSWKKLKTWKKLEFVVFGRAPGSVKTIFSKNKKPSFRPDI